MNRQRVGLLRVIAILVILFFALDLHQYLTLETLKRSRDALAAYYAPYPLTVIALYFVTYVLVAALSVPGPRS